MEGYLDAVVLGAKTLMRRVELGALCSWLP